MASWRLVCRAGHNDCEVSYFGLLQVYHIIQRKVYSPKWNWAIITHINTIHSLDRWIQSANCLPRITVWTVTIQTQLFERFLSFLNTLCNIILLSKKTNLAREPAPPIIHTTQLSLCGFHWIAHKFILTTDYKNSNEKLHLTCDICECELCPLITSIISLY